MYICWTKLKILTYILKCAYQILLPPLNNLNITAVHWTSRFHLPLPFEVALIFKYSGFDFCGEQLNISIEKGKTNVERSFLWVIQYSIFSENGSRKVAFTSHVIEIFVSSLQNPITYLHYQIIDEHILQISEYIRNLLHPHENRLDFRLSFISTLVMVPSES